MLQLALHYLQRFGLSAAFFWLAWGRLEWLLDDGTWNQAEMLLRVYPATSPEGVAVIQRIAQNALQVAFNVLVGGLLLTIKKPTQPPERVSHVIVPLLMTFGFLGYALVNRISSPTDEIRLLPNLGLGAVVVSGLLAILAYAFSFASLLYLRRSFAVFVEVRKGVMAGPYRYIRHPMYLGYTLVVAAMFLVRPTLTIALLSVVVIGIMLVRIRLEEEMLARHVPGYAEHMKRTGRLFPRLRRPPTGGLPASPVDETSELDVEASVRVRVKRKSRRDHGDA